MRDMNELLIEVRLGNDGILRETKSGKKVLNFGGANHATSDKETRSVGRIPHLGKAR